MGGTTHRRRVWRGVAAVVLSLALGSILGPAQVAAGATLGVTNCNDSGPGSLRQAVTSAASGSTITFALSPACSTITLTSGEIDITTSLTISGPGASALAVSGDLATRVFEVEPGASVAISGLSIEDGAIPGGINSVGGGIRNGGTLTVNHCVFADDTANQSGGAIYNDFDASLTITDSSLVDNRSDRGGAIDSEGTSLTITASSMLDNAADDGAGISTDGSTLTVTDSTVAGNAASGYGGGIASGGAMILSDSTVANNSAGAQFSGGGIISSATLVITNSTVSGNTAMTGAGLAEGYDSMTLTETIVADNAGGDCTGSVTDGGFNLDDDGSCGLTLSTDHSDTPAGLDPTGFESNGGPAPTVALEPGSPALGAVTNAMLCSGPDERGVVRPTPCDIGAYQTTILTVTTCTDSGVGSLRTVLQNAVFGDTITFAPTPSCSTITLASTLDITTTVAIDGPGSNTLAVSGNNAVEVFAIASGVTATISGLTVEHGAGTAAGGGGGIDNSGTLTMTYSAVSDNTASALGGGVSNLGTLTVIHSAVTGNSTGTGTGLSGLNGGGGIFSDGELSVQDSTVSDNGTAVAANPSDGGAIANAGGLVDITGSTVSGNSALGDVTGPGETGEGGAIWNGQSGFLSVDDSTMAANRASADGGAIDDTGGGLGILAHTTLSDNNAAGDGGGIDNGGSVWIVSASTLAGDTAVQGGGIDNAGTMLVETSTISGGNAGLGGGVDNSGQLAVTLSTVAGSVGGGLDNGGGATLDLAGSVVADSTAGKDCTGPVMDAGYNLDDDGSCGLSAAVGSQANTNPLLGPLQNNGGPTETQAPETNSPADGQIPYGTTAIGTTLCPGTDQRGVSRPQGTKCDEGAVEMPLQSQAIHFTSVPPGNAIVRGPSYTVTATGGGSGNPVTFSSATPSVCSVTGATVTFTGAGMCGVLADQAGNGSYFAAPETQQNVSVGPGIPAITSPNSASGTVGTPFSFMVTTTGIPTPSVTEKGRLQKQLRFTDNQDGSATISGTPEKAGVAHLTIKASYGKGKSKSVVTQAFTLTVAKG